MPSEFFHVIQACVTTAILVSSRARVSADTAVHIAVITYRFRTLPWLSGCPFLGHYVS